MESRSFKHDNILGKWLGIYVLCTHTTLPRTAVPKLWFASSCYCNSCKAVGHFMFPLS